MSLLPWDSISCEPYWGYWERPLNFWRRPEPYYHGPLFSRHLMEKSLSEKAREEFKNMRSVLQDTEAAFSDDKFQANIDVQQFKPAEISVKVTGDNTITVEGKHEEKQDEHGYISRHFVRKYTLPENCDVKYVRSKLSSDGVLTVTAPKIGEKKIEYVDIPVVRTGQPVKGVKKTSEGQKCPK